MAKKINFSQISANYTKGMQGATAKYTQGVLGVTVSPGQLAASQAGKWLANLQASETKWQNAMNALTLTQWQNATTSKASRLATGAAAAAPKLDKYYNSVGSQIQGLADQIHQQKASGTTTGLDRVSAWMVGMAQISKSYKG